MKKTDELQIPEVVLEVRKNRSKQIRRKMKEYWPIYVMMIPVVLFYLVFSYYPMYGIVLAITKDFDPRLGITGSLFQNGATWDHFTNLLSKTYGLDYDNFILAIKNTLTISFLKILLMFPMPIIMALLLNEVKSSGYKKTVQNIIFLPNFISWTIWASVYFKIFGEKGYIDNIWKILGGYNRMMDGKAHYVLSEDPDIYYFLVIFMSNLKVIGWNSIIYMAAISAVSPTLYEAGTIDGCGRFRLMWNVTIPCIGPVIILQFLLAIGNIMNAGSEEFIFTYTGGVKDKYLTFDVYIYNLINPEKGSADIYLGSAAGLFKSIINFALLMGSNFLVKKFTGAGIYDLND